MASGEWNPTLRQLLRAALKIIVDAATMPFWRRKTFRYTSADPNLRASIYYAKSGGLTPAVLLLPTAMGLTPHEHAMASRLAREGYTTLVIAYSKRTTGAVIKDDVRRENLEHIVLAGWRALLADPMTDAGRAAVIGLSLGGYFATYLAAIGEERGPKAAVVYYGTYSLAQTHLTRLRVPLLILQGEKDDRDFVLNAEEAKEFASRNNAACEVVLYPGAGHQFDLFEPGGAAARDAWERTIRFLRQHLGPATPG